MKVSVQEPDDTPSDDKIFRMVIDEVVYRLEQKLELEVRNKSELMIMTSINDLDALKYEDEIDMNNVLTIINSAIDFAYSECYNSFAYKYDGNMQNGIYAQIAREIRYRAQEYLQKRI